MLVFCRKWLFVAKLTIILSFVPFKFPRAHHSTHVQGIHRSMEDMSDRLSVSDRMGLSKSGRVFWQSDSLGEDKKEISEVLAGAMDVYQGHLVEAAEHFERVMGGDQDYIDAQVGLGHVFFVMAGLRDGDLFLNTDAVVKPTFRDRLGEDRRSLTERGIASYKNALREEFLGSRIWADPSCGCSSFDAADIRNSLGFGYWALGKLDSARIEFQRAQSMSRTDGDAAKLLKYMSSQEGGR